MTTETQVRSRITNVPATTPAPTKVVKYVRGRYVYTGGSTDMLGKLIGREGRNIREIERLTNTSIEFYDSWAWIGGESAEEETLVAAFIWALHRNPGMSVFPRAIQVIFGIMKKDIDKFKESVITALSICEETMESLCGERANGKETGNGKDKCSNKTEETNGGR